ncbi:pseudouridylate synthase 1 homolog [Oppia nitens]|uniref:pseudouridylate synthase 1 homolog n=1 Tax=Oppia nitens TaxID=1686743 RepID=UPI0023DC37CF|nr:pseudouridylate synthase 1 homolog [Oppia nitens]
MKTIAKHLIRNYSFSYNCLNSCCRRLCHQMSEQLSAENTVVQKTDGLVVDPELMATSNVDSNDRSDESSAAKRLKTSNDDDNDGGEGGGGIDRTVQSTSSAVNQRPNFKREKNLKWALLLSYCGQRYYGMQRQIKSDIDFPTIEYRLFDALLKAGIIGEDKFNEQHLCRFQRAARTDKGVSAIKQICSAQLPANFRDRIPEVNEHLPEQIRLVDSIRVTKFFDAKNYCDARTYSYLMPTFALTDIEDLTQQSYRLSAEKLQEFNDILAMYLGTHNYHNFTSSKAPTDASAMRYIMSMDCSQPFMMKQLMEFVVIRVKGQSFMLHQIRKMIGLAIAVMRGLTPKDTILRAFDSKRIDIPKAPGLGLLLEEVHYEKYNDKYGGDGIHESISWETMKDTIDQFKHQHIYPVIVDTELNELSMFEWLKTLMYHTYDEREQKANELIRKTLSAEESVEDSLRQVSRSMFWKANRKANNSNEDNTSGNDNNDNKDNCNELDKQISNNNNNTNNTNQSYV